MLEKSVSVTSDTIIYDFEDSVAPSQKVSARSNLTTFLKSNSNETKAEIAVRVNQSTSPLFAADVAVAASPDVPVNTLVIPKVHSPQDLDRLADVGPTLTGGGTDKIDVIASVESAQALWNIGDIARWHNNVFRVAALLFAAEDYCADTSIVRTRARTELLYARSHIVNAAKAFGLQAIDMVCVNYKDPEYLRDECEDGRRLGFDGKQAIHPNQVETIQTTFVPSQKEISRAAAIVEQMKAARASNRGAFGLSLPQNASESTSSAETEMIDEPMLKQALKTLERAHRAGLSIPKQDTVVPRSSTATDCRKIAPSTSCL